MQQSELQNSVAHCLERLKLGFYEEEPFKHLIVDDFLPRQLAVNCLQSFPDLSDGTWEHEDDSDIEIKSRTTWSSEFDIPENIVDAVRMLNSGIILRAFSDIFDIPKLIPDPYFSGGGLNATVRGGLLDVHVDGNYHDATGLNRRMNALVYLNPNWEENWGGEFGLYNSDGSQLVKKISPIFNRLVVFDSHDQSFHGLPNPIQFPEGEIRRSIILYYYTVASRPAAQVRVTEPHSALWVKRGLRDKRGDKARKHY